MPESDSSIMTGHLDQVPLSNLKKKRCRGSQTDNQYSTPIICRTRARPGSNVVFDGLRYLCVCESLRHENIHAHVEAACTPFNEKVQLDETNLVKLDQTRDFSKCSLQLLFGAATARTGFFLNANKCCGRVATAIAIFAFAA
jgi:hypothetical protein